MARDGTPMQRLRDRKRVSVAPERIRYLEQRGLEQAVETVEVVAAEALSDAADVDARVDGVLDGTEEFTGLNAAGTDVAPFLAKTDGSKLTDAAAFEDDLVPTAKIAPNAASDSVSVQTLGTINLLTTSQVIIEQFDIEVEAGWELDILATATVHALGQIGGTRGDFLGRPTLTVYRGTTFLGGTRPLSVKRDTEDYASATIAAKDAPPAGTHTLYFYSDIASIANITTLEAEQRFFGARRVKR